MARSASSRILEAARSIFLSRGYAGTTIDEMTRVAGLSRGSFYNCFSAKRDVLLVLGVEAARAGTAAIERMWDVPRAWSESDLLRFVEDYFAMLDDHGSFSFAWTQAAHEDEELRQAGMTGHLDMCRRLGVAAGALRGVPFDDPTLWGLVIFGMLERAWAYCQLYDDAIDPGEVRRDLARCLASLLQARST
jgi:AcrR family transcriptional regulator